MKMFKFTLFMVVILGSCNLKKTEKKVYFNHIGETKFTSEKDNKNFQFCDSTNVFHSRSRIQYTGENRAIENQLIKNYTHNSDFKFFTGYFFIRFAVNCKNETGRFRWDIVDENYEETTCSKALENKVISLVKNLKNWNCVVYNDKNYDGYTFLIVKFKNGNIVRL